MWFAAFARLTVKYINPDDMTGDGMRTLHKICKGPLEADSPEAAEQIVRSHISANYFGCFSLDIHELTITEQEDPRMTKIGTIYTIGYSTCASIDDLARIAVERDALLIDVRMSTRTGYAEFDIARLMRIPNYRHVPEYGNRNYHTGPIELAEPDKGAAILLPLLREHNLLLLCGCAEPDKCHRLEVAGHLWNQAIHQLVGTSAIEHLFGGRRQAVGPGPMKTKTELKAELHGATQLKLF